VLASVALSALAAVTPAGASNISDLHANYSGKASSTSISDFEDVSTFSLENIVKQSNGKFTATAGGLFSFNGKVSPKGKITLQGQFNNTVGMDTFKLHLKGSALLSATGHYISGQISIDGKKNGAPYHDLQMYFLTADDLQMMSAPAGGRTFLNLR
jgi:hypothetical protein